MNRRSLFEYALIVLALAYVLGHLLALAAR